MFDDDDDVDPQINDVDKYHFEEGKGVPVCFSVLLLKFDDNDTVGCLDSKKVDLHGFADHGLHTVHKKVVAWRVELDYEQPKISVLSCEGNWIELLKPRRCYEDTVRSVLITVQMLHFVRKWPRKHKRSLWDHLREVFSKFDNKPVEYDLRKHHSLIKLFAEKDPTLMKSKILQSCIEDSSRKIKEGTGIKEPCTPASSSVDEEGFDNDDDYDDKDDNGNDDYSCNDEDSDDDDNGDGNDKDDSSNDDYSCNDDDSNNDDNVDDGDTDTDTDDDGDTDNDDGGGTDDLCAICDNGGKLLSCRGRCKRAFHPREKDGRKFNCETLGYTSAQLQEIDIYLCKNCEYQQHQCFKCGKLEPSDGPNAKVFQCYKASCGHFYHPRCVAKLLEPGDTNGACELEKRITEGMSFTCPVHWCSKCGNMEDSTQEALWLGVCRRCPNSYHKECLPSEISFKKKRRKSIRAWCLPNRIIIYCMAHRIIDSIETPLRDHIKLPSIPEINRTRDLAKDKTKASSSRQGSTNQGSTESAELSKKLSREKGDQTKIMSTTNSMEHVDLDPKCAINLLKEDLQIDPSMVGAAAATVLSNPEAVNGQEKQLGTSSSFAMGTILKSQSHVVDNESLRNGKNKDASEREKISQHYSEEERCVPKKDTFHAIQEHVEGDELNLKSGNEPETDRGENAYGQNSISGQGISMTENRMGESTYEHDSTSGKEKIARNESSKLGSSNVGLTPDHVDLPPEKHVQAAYVENTTTTNRTDIQQERGGDGDQGVDWSNACQHDSRSPRCNGSLRETEIYTSGDKSSKRREPKQQATDGKKLNLDRNGKNVHVRIGRDARHEDEITANVHAQNGPQHTDNRKESDVLDYKLRKNDLVSPRGNDDPGVAETSEYKSRERRSNSREERGNSMRVNSCSGNSPMGSRKCSDGDGRRRRSRDDDYYSDADRRTRRSRDDDYSDDHRRSRDDYYSDGNGDRRSHDDYSSDGHGDRRGPRPSALSPANFGTNGRRSSRSHPGREEYGTSERHRSPSYPRSEYIASGRHIPRMYPRRPEHVDYAMDRSTIPLGNNPPGVEHGRYHTMGIVPDDRYPLQENYSWAYGPRTDTCMGEHASPYGGRISDFGVRPDYQQRDRLSWEHRAPAAGSVIEKYAPQLSLTNQLTRGHGRLLDASLLYGDSRTYLGLP